MIEVTLNINLVTKFKKDTTFPCAIIAIGGQIDTDNFVVDGGIETASGTAKVSSSSPTSAVCTLSIPYEWTFQNDGGASSGLVLAFAAAGVTPWGATLRTTLQLTGIESLPATGSTSKFTFDTSL